MNKKLYLIYPFILMIFIFFIGCALDEVINLTNSQKIEFGIWDLEFNAPLIEKNFTMNELLYDRIDIKKEVSKMSDDATFEEDQDGLYYIKYNFKFDDIDKFSNHSLKKQIQNTFTNYPYEYTGPDFPSIPDSQNEWPLPLALDKQNLSTDPVIVPNLLYDGKDDGYFTLNMHTLGAVTKNLTIDLTSNEINRDLNSDGSDDILLKGISDKNAKLSLHISILDGDTKITNLRDGDIKIIKFRMEGKDCIFTLDPLTNFNSNQETDTLIYYTIFPDPFMFNGAGGDTNWNEFKIEDFEYAIKCDDSPTRTKYKTNNNLKLHIKAEVNFGDKLKIVAIIYPVTFDTGVQHLSGFDKLLDFLDKDVKNAKDEVTKLQNKIISSFSLHNLSLQFDISSDIPFPVTLNNFFDDKVNYKNLPSLTNQYPVNKIPDPTTDVPKVERNGGIFSYFDIDENGMVDTVKTLHPAIIKEYIIGESINEQTRLTTLLFNDVGDFIKIKNKNNSKFVVAKKVYLGEVFYFAGTTHDTTIDIDLLYNDNLMKIKSFLKIPVSLNFFDDTTDIDMMKVINNTGELPAEVKDITNFLPIGKIKELSLNLNIENKFPIGVEFDILITAEPLDDINRKIIPLSENNDKIIITAGKLKEVEGRDNLFYVSEKSDCFVKLKINEKFKYKTNYTDTEFKTYDKDFIHLLNNSKKILLELRFRISSTNNKNINFTKNDYIAGKIAVNGKTTIDVNKYFKNNIKEF